ncbi:MAG: hypothetical protein AB7O59_15360 [Pirellulales bacterium]
MSAVESRRAARADGDLHSSESAKSLLSAHVQAALAALLEAHEYARDLDTSDWDFAVEIETLRRLKLTNRELRWLLARELVEHALEIPRMREGTRDFLDSGRPHFGRRSCFVLTAAGVELAYDLRGGVEAEDAPAQPAAPAQELRERPAYSLARTPRWDRNRRELRVGSMLVKRYNVASLDQESVLAAFEEAGWQSRIDNPLPCQEELARKTRLQETVHLLNHLQKRTLVRFFGDTSGQSILWEFHRDATDAAAAGHDDEPPRQP